ncbi:hypothetical protein CKF54_04630 [Psittacicella hinzii]|uniref:Ribosome maturation factor RimM n=1 Tax=Psittacicella hinzii TaxID=2028575 RepID=A0A3A1Y584_9GAMM|nr:ribosome maturation factor RimM [Psittacicella hinzii]RIY32530.1 hypothetical protein CKF54_04630 [Psittacicella hinzii]
MAKKEKLITLGKFGSTYGYKGWIRVNSFTEEPTNIFSYANWFVNINNTLTPVKVESWKVHANHLVCKLDCLDSLEEAKAFNNLFVYVKGEDLPELDGEYYWKDLMGCKVFTPAGYELGTVTQIMETGANDVLVLQAPLTDAYNRKDRMVPFIDKYLVEVDINNKKIVIEWDPEF